jgi:hypothetical protein
MSHPDIGAGVAAVTQSVRTALHDHVEATSHTLEERFAHEQQAFLDLVQHAQQALAAASSSSHQHALEVQSRFQALDAEVREAGANARSDLQGLLQIVTEFDQAAHDAIAAVHAASQGIVSTIDQFDQHAQQLARAAADVLGTLDHEVDAAHTHVGQLQAQLDQATQSLESDVTQRAHSLQSGLDAFGEQATHQVADLSSRVGSAVEDLANGDNQHLLREVSPALDQGVSQVKSQFDTFEHVAEQVSSQFDSSVGQVMQKLGQISQVLDDIKPVIEMIKAVD